MERYLFIYGTLSPRHAPAEISGAVRRLRRVGKGSVQGKLYDLGEYPGAVLSKSGNAISGEVFALPEDGELLSSL
ncbi:MAG TPA: gamma-glutamylcyclotransferase family protein, partial [Terriglobales bacterium]